VTNRPIMDTFKRILPQSLRPNVTYIVPVAVNCSYCTPDDGYRKYPKRVELSCNKIKILVSHLVGHFVSIFKVEVLLRVLRYSPVVIIPLILYSNLFLDAIKTVQLRTSLNNTVTIRLSWLILTGLHNKGHKSGVIFHGVYYLLFIIQICYV
jgi:hypothetical protein